MFGCFLGLRSFDSLKGLLICNQVSFPINFNGVRFILTSTIAPTTYLGSWALIVLIIIIRFMVDQRPFLLGTLAWIDNNTFPVQHHLKATCDFLPPLAHVCFLLFKQFIKQQLIQFQDCISECLHHHTFANILFDGTFENHCVWILSCYGPKVSIWFTTWPIFPTFWLFFSFFSIAFCMRLWLPHPSITCIPWCVCAHPIDLMGIHLLCCVHDNECTGTHDAIHNTFVTIGQNVSFCVGREQLHALPSITFNSFCQWVEIVLTKDNIRTLTYIVIVNPIQVHLLPWSCTTQRCVASNGTQAKERSYHNWHPTRSIPPFSNWSIWLFTQTCPCVFTWCAYAIWSLKGPKGLHLFTFVTFLCKKNLITLQRM